MGSRAVGEQHGSSTGAVRAANAFPCLGSGSQSSIRCSSDGCERVLEPKRLLTMVGALIARNARHRDREREQLRELFAKQRDLSQQVRNLVDVMEQGGLGAMRPLQTAPPSARKSWTNSTG
jgi:hypothetical protein